MPDTVLEQVSVIMQPQADSGLTENFIIPIPSLTQASSPGIVYVSFTRDSPEEYAVASFQCVLKFISKEVDPTSGEPEEEGYEDEYQLEDVELAPGGDYIIPSYASFAAEWERLRNAATAVETFALSAMDSIKGTVSINLRFTVFAYLDITQLHAIRLLRFLTWNLSEGRRAQRQHLCIRCSYRAWSLGAGVKCWSVAA